VTESIPINLILMGHCDNGYLCQLQVIK